MRNAAFLLLCGLAACGGPDWEGKYNVTGQWDLSGPLSDGRAASDAIAELMINKFATAAPLPSGLEDDLAVALTLEFKPVIKDFIEESLTTELGPEGEVTVALRQALASTRIESTLEIEEGMEGKETFNAIVMDSLVGEIRLTPGDIKAPRFEAEWEGDEEDDHFDVEEHDIPLNFGELVNKVAFLILGELKLDGLFASILAATQCSPLVNLMLNGRDALTVDLGLTDVDISDDLLVSVCQLVRGQFEKKAFSLFESESGAEVGGRVDFAGTKEGDYVLTSGENFSGILKIAPDELAPRIRVSFRAMQLNE